MRLPGKWGQQGTAEPFTGAGALVEDIARRDALAGRMRKPF
jgi:hypothetical protein